MNEQRTERGSRFISLQVKLLVGFTLLFTAVFAVAFYWFYNFASGMALQRIQEDLTDTLMAAAEGVDAERFVALAKEGVPRQDGYTDDPRYWEHVNWLVTVNKIEPRAQVYTYVRGKEKNQVLFVGSIGAVADPPWGVKFLEPYTSTGSLIRGLDGTTYRSNFKPYEDKWGRWVSGYTPIKSKQGELVGGLGIDFRADYVYEVQQAIRDRVWIAFGITYATLFILVFLVSRTLTRPIVALTRTAERIGEGDYEQDLSYLTKGRFSDEIGTLARVFSIMVGKVYQREQKLIRQVEELKIEIDEVKRKKQVSEIVESDFFQDLRAKAREMRDRGRHPAQDAPGDESS